MMKPNWKDAPEWAKYLAMDSDCEWYWYEERPKMMSATWQLTSGKALFIEPDADYWRETLEKRP